MSQLSRVHPSPTHPDTIMDQYTFAVNTALDEHAPAVLRRPHKRSTYVDTVLISMRCISFAVTVRAFGEHLAWKYTGTSMWAIGTLSPMRCVKRRPITTRIYLRSPIRMKHSKQWTVDSGQSVEGGH